MNARDFVNRVRRLAAPRERPGEQVGSRIDAAWIAAISEIVRSYGEVSSLDLIGIEATMAAPHDGDEEMASVTSLSDPAQTLGELEAAGESVVAITVRMESGKTRIGVVVFSIRLER